MIPERFIPSFSVWLFLFLIFLGLYGVYYYGIGPLTGWPLAVLHLGLVAFAATVCASELIAWENREPEDETAGAATLFWGFLLLIDFPASIPIAGIWYILNIAASNHEPREYHEGIDRISELKAFAMGWRPTVLFGLFGTYWWYVFPRQWTMLAEWFSEAPGFLSHQSAWDLFDLIVLGLGIIGVVGYILVWCVRIAKWIGRH